MALFDAREFVLKKISYPSIVFISFIKHMLPSCLKYGQLHNSKLQLEQSLKDNKGISEVEPIAIISSALCATKDIAQAIHVSGNMDILATAIVYIKYEVGNLQPCRALRLLMLVINISDCLK